MATVNKIGVANNQIKPLLELFRLVLPIDNELPTTFNAMKSFIDTSSLVTVHNICTICNQEISNAAKTCKNEDCPHNNNIRQPSVIDDQL